MEGVTLSATTPFRLAGSPNRPGTSIKTERAQCERLDHWNIQIRLQKKTRAMFLRAGSVKRSQGVCSFLTLYSRGNHRPTVLEAIIPINNVNGKLMMILIKMHSMGWKFRNSLAPMNSQNVSHTFKQWAYFYLFFNKINPYCFCPWSVII